MAFIAAMSFVWLVFLWMSVKIVPEYQRILVFTLGRVASGLKGPGVVVVIPFVQKVHSIDLGSVSHEKNEQFEVVEVSQTMVKVKRGQGGNILTLDIKK